MHSTYLSAVWFWSWRKFFIFLVAVGSVNIFSPQEETISDRAGYISCPGNSKEAPLLLWKWPCISQQWATGPGKSLSGHCCRSDTLPASLVTNEILHWKPWANVFLQVLVAYCDMSDPVLDIGTPEVGPPLCQSICTCGTFRLVKWACWPCTGCAYQFSFSHGFHTSHLNLACQVSRRSQSFYAVHVILSLVHGVYSC